MCKTSCSNTWYFGLHKNKKTSRSEYVCFKSTNFIKFCYFCVAHNIKNLVVKFCVLADYIIDYVLIYLYSFFKLKTIIFLKNGGSLGAKSTFRFLSSYILILTSYIILPPFQKCKAPKIWPKVNTF
jgi:hypothetical protein